MKLLASTVAEISRGPNFVDATLAQTPPNSVLIVLSWYAIPRTQVV